MSRILLAWELGAGYGHLGPFLGLAPSLLARGHELHIAAREVSAAVQAVGELPIAVHQAPLCLNTYGGLQEPPLNYSEILMRFGYLEPQMLGGLIAAWRSLLRVTAADLLLADHAPTALLAARELGLPRGVIGSPFNVPPPRAPAPNMRDWAPVPESRLADSDRRVLDVVNACLRAPPLAAVHEIFAGAAAFFSGIAELDPYGGRHPHDYLGLTARSAGVSPPQWPPGAGPAVFAYLHADHPQFEQALQALAASRARVLAYVHGPGWQPPSGGAGSLVFAQGLLDFDRVVASCDLCLCHGNVGTTLGMLRGGKPVLVLPKHLEHFLLGRALQRLGAGRVIPPQEQAPDIGAELAAMLADPACAASARALAQREAPESVGTMNARAVARIEALAASAKEHA